MLIFTVIVSGFGALVWTNRQSSTLDFGVQAIVGLLTLTAAGEWLNIFLPLGSGLATGTALLGLILFAIKSRQIYRSIGVNPALFLIALIAFIPVLGMDAVLGGVAADTGLYHVPAIKWIEESNRVLGLANLHSRFGFNSSFFVVAALFDWPHSGRVPLFTLTEAIAFITTLSMIQPIVVRPFSEVILRPSSLYAGCLAAIVFYESLCTPFGGLTSSPAYDTPAAIIACYSFWAFLAWGEAREEGDWGRAQSARRGLVAATTLAVTFKLSAVPIVLLLIIVLTLELRRSPEQRRILSRDPVNWIAAALVASWIVTSIMLSGCAVYPVASTCVALPWGVPRPLVSGLAGVIRGWARLPGENFGSAVEGWAWLHDWARRLWATPAVRQQLDTLCVAVALWLPLIPLYKPVIAWMIIRPSKLLSFGISLIVGFIGLAFWFISAPDPRFGQAFLVATPALIGSAALWCWTTYRPARLLLRLAPLAIGVWFYEQSYVSYPVYWMMARQVEKWPVIPQPEFIEIESGPPPSVTLRYISNGQCWDVERPCVAKGEWSPGLHEEPSIGIWRVYAAAPAANP